MRAQRDCSPSSGVAFDVERRLFVRVCWTVAAAVGLLATTSTWAHEPEEPADGLRREQIPFEELRIAGGGATSRVPRELVAILGTGRFRHPHRLQGMVFSPDGQTLVTQGGPVVRLWDVRSGKLVHEFESGTWGNGLGEVVVGLQATTPEVRFSPDGRLLAWCRGATEHRSLAVWNGSEVKVLPNTERGLQGIEFSPDGRWIASTHSSCEADYTDHVYVRNVRTGEFTVACADYGTNSAFLGFGWGSEVAVTESDDDGEVWATATGKLLRTIVGCQFQGISPDGKAIAYVNSGDIEVEDIKSGNPLRRLSSCDHDYLRAAFCADGRLVVLKSTRDEPKLLRLAMFDVAKGREEPAVAIADPALASQPEPDVAIASSSDGKHVALTGFGDVLRMCDMGTRRVLWTLPNENASVKRYGKVVPQRIERVVFSPQGRTVLVSKNNRSVRLLEVATGKDVAEAAAALEHVSQAAYNPRGEILAVGQGFTRFENRVARLGTRARLWNIAAAKEMFPDSGHAAAVTCLCFSADGCLIASGAVDGTVKLWNVATASLLRTAEGPGNRVLSVALSRDAGQLAYATLAGIRLRNVATGRLLRDSRASWNSRVLPALGTRVAFLPDGTTLAIAAPAQPDAAPVVQFWDGVSGENRHPLGKNPLPACTLALSVDGRMLATQLDGAIALWDIASGKRLPLLDAKVGGIAQCAFSPDGSRLVAVRCHVDGVGSSNATLLTEWDVRTGRRVLASTNPWFQGAAVFARDGKHLWVSDTEGHVRKLRAESGEEAGRIRIGDFNMYMPLPFALSPSGRYLACGMPDGTVQILRTPPSD